MYKTPLFASLLTFSLAGFAHAETLTAFDVSENHTRIFMANAPMHENGMPAHGNAFISQGYIYPAGTLEADTRGVTADGLPAFPDLVLGTWTCDGYFVGEGANAKTGVWIISRQVFAFEDGNTIITQGTEIADTGIENPRPITGATGDYADHSGSMVQTLLGFSEQMTVNVRFHLKDGVETELDPLEWDSGGPVGPIGTVRTVPET